MGSQAGNKRASKAASQDTAMHSGGGRGRAAVELPEPFRAVIDAYSMALRTAPLTEQTRRTYASKVRQYLAWLADRPAVDEPLDAEDARDRAVGDYRTHLQTVLDRKPTTINNALAALDDFYVRRGMGPAGAPRAALALGPPKALSKRDSARYLRAAQACPSPRDRAIALVPFYAGARIGELVALDVDDVRLSARPASLRIQGTAAKVREIPIHRELRGALTTWLHQRRTWAVADSPALFLNQRGTRLSVRAIHHIITTIAQSAGLHDTTAHVLRHTFATRLAKGDTNLVTIAQLLGHTRLESTRIYSHPTRKDALRALDLLD